jgi:hypothetical protein
MMTDIVAVFNYVHCISACADVMNGVLGVVNGSCTSCDGFTAANCSVASCSSGYHSFVGGVGCSGNTMIIEVLYMKKGMRVHTEQSIRT